MADRVGYMLGSPDGVLSHFLGGPLKDFAVWYIQALEEFPEELSAARFALLQKVLQRGKAAFEDANPQEVNALVLDYYSTYANINNLLNTTHDYWDKFVYHRALVDLFRQRGEQQTATFLDHTVRGRFLHPQPQTCVDREEYDLSFWTKNEVLDLQRRLGPWSAQNWTSITRDEHLRHALRTTAEALKIAAAHDTGLIIFVGW